MTRDIEKKKKRYKMHRPVWAIAARVKVRRGFGWRIVRMVTTRKEARTDLREYRTMRTKKFALFALGVRSVRRDEA